MHSPDLLQSPNKYRHVCAHFLPSHSLSRTVNLAQYYAHDNLMRRACPGICPICRGVFATIQGKIGFSCCRYRYWGRALHVAHAEIAVGVCVCVCAIGIHFEKTVFNSIINFALYSRLRSNSMHELLAVHVADQLH